MRCYAFVLWAYISQSSGSKLFQDWGVFFNRGVLFLDQSGSNSAAQLSGTEELVSLYRCLKSCHERQACDFINYHVILQFCMFIRHVDRNSSVTVEERSGYAYSRKSDWNVVGVDTNCQQCNLTDRCLEKATGTSCEPASCGAPIYSNLTTIKGNNFNIGANLKIICKFSSDLVTYASCREDGVWIHEDVTCPDTFPSTTSNSTSATPPISTTSTTTPTTTPDPPPFSCHGRDDIFRTIELTDGTTTTYSVRYNNKETFEDAKDKCNQLNANLLKVTTSAKLAFVMALYECSGFGNQNLWIDGQKGQNSAVFTTWDGDTIPMTDEFFQSLPKVDDDQGCVRLMQRKGFKLDDRACSKEYYYICERQLE